MACRIVLAVLLVIAAPCSHAQSNPARPAFEVASVRLHPNCEGKGSPGRTSPGRLDFPCMSLRGVIRIAYSAFVGEEMTSQRLEVLGGPPWLDTDRYHISAKAEDGASAAQMMGPMLRALLEERFKVKAHTESRDTSVYALTVWKKRPKLAPSKEGSCTPMDLNTLPENRPQSNEPAPRYCGWGSVRGNGATMIFDWYGVTVARFAGLMLSREVGRPVVDKTELPGRYDIHFEFVRTNVSSGPVLLNGVPVSPAEAPQSDASSPSIFTALQEQLGLTLSPAKGPINVIVVDHVERPSEN